MAKNKLRSESFITIDGIPVPFKDLDEFKQRDYKNNTLRNIERTVSDYFSKNPNEADAFFRGQKNN